MASSTSDRNRVCLVTPGHLSTNPRLVKEADALVGAGYEVRVVAARFIHWADEADKEFDNRDWSVTRVGFGPFASRVCRVGHAMKRRLFQRLSRFTGPVSWIAEGAFHPVIPALIRAACAEQADLYIAHNLAALPAASRAAEVHGAKLGFDAEDFHSGELPARPENEWTRCLVRAIEKRYLPKCQHLTAASPGIAKAYALEYGIKEPTVVLNVFSKKDAPKCPAINPDNKHSPSLYWFSQTVGPDRGIETAIEAIARSRSRPYLVLRGNPSPGYREHLVDKAKNCGVGDRLRFAEPASPSSMLSLAAIHDLGLASEIGLSRNNQLALSNKLFTYLLAGVPVLASATPAQTEIGQSMHGSLLLYPPTDAGVLAAAMDQLLLTPGALDRARRAAWRLGQQRYNWETEQMVFLQSIASALRCRIEGND